jgi:hypothetical protein
MAIKRLKEAAFYLAALLAVSFGIDWGFRYILLAHRRRLERKRLLPQAAP